jgi:hypothetical protein
MDFRGNPLCFHFMFSINSYLLKCAKNKNIGHTSSMKKENKFIPLSWKIGEIYVKKIYLVDEFTTQFDYFNLEKVHAIQGFNPNNLFLAHMVLIGYNSPFNNYV